MLTGWHNRRYLQVRLMEELARARRITSEGEGIPGLMDSVAAAKMPFKTTFVKRTLM